MVFGEYAHGVRIKTQLNYKLSTGPMFELSYIHYNKAQEAIKFNYQVERGAIMSVTFNFSFLNGYTRWSFKQNVFEKFTYNTANLTFSSFWKKLNTNISTYANWLGGGKPYVYGNLGLGIRFGHGFKIRPQGQVDIIRKQLTLVKAEIEKDIFRSGYLSVFGVRNINSSYNSFLFSFRWNFSFSQVNFNAHIYNKESQLTQGARGSFAFGSGNDHVHADTRSAVGMSGITIIPFADLNHNGEKDDGEPLAKGLTVKTSGGKVLRNMKDSITRITGLQPYTNHILTIHDKELEQISWQLKDKKLCVYTDPNQFKKIYIPVLPMGEVNGRVFLKEVKETKGQGRSVVNFYSDNGKFVATTMTESQGNFTFLGLPPGNYYAAVDTTQLKKLNMRSIPAKTDFSIKPLIDDYMVYDVQFVIERISEEIK